MLVILALDFYRFTGMGVWRPGFLYLISAIIFMNNLSELYIFSSVPA